jgi:hypothetical protein
MFATDYPLDQLVVGCISSLFGLILIIFHRSIKEWRDYWQAKDFPVGAGEMWTGRYTKAGLIFTYGVTILVGVIFLGFGIGFIVNAVRS